MSRERLTYLAFDDPLAPKGAAIHIERFARALADAHEGVDLVTPSSSPGLTPHLWPGVDHFGLPATGRSLVERVSTFRAHLLAWWGGRRMPVAHVRSIYEGYPIARQKARMCDRFVLEVNGLPSIELKYHYPAAGEDAELQRKLRAQEQRCMEAADLVVTPSSVTAAYLRQRGVPADRLRVIPNGVDAELFSYRAPRQHDVGPLRLLYVGTMAAWQGVNVAIDALALLRQAIDARLVLAGPVRARERPGLLRHIVRRGVSDAVELVGPLQQEALSALYAECDVALAPLMPNDRNLAQGCCPLKVLEAMAAGTPLVASDMPVVRELAADEQHALLVRPASAAAVREAVLRLAADPELARRISAAARRRVEERFRWERAQAELLAAYDGLLSPRRSATDASAALSAAG